MEIKLSWVTSRQNLCTYTAAVARVRTVTHFWYWILKETMTTRLKWWLSALIWVFESTSYNEWAKCTLFYTQPFTFRGQIAFEQVTPFTKMHCSLLLLCFASIFWCFTTMNWLSVDWHETVDKTQAKTNKKCCKWLQKLHLFLKSFLQTSGDIR